MTAKLIIEIVTEAAQTKKALSDTGDGVKDLGNKAGIMGKALIAGAAAGAAGLIALGVHAFEAASESAKIGRETERVIKSIGAASWTSADQVADLSAAISDKTGADDEAIQSGANLLLTFANIKNEVGEGNDVFDQATGLALDMSTALGTDMSGAAVQLGKALNDPIKGITALSKAGVSFSEDQKAQIKLLTESGDLLGAQKIVLAELNKEFAGAAEAAGTPLEKLQVKIGNVEEAIGGLLIPAVDAVAEAIGSNMGPAIEKATGWITDHTELLKYLGSVALVGLAGAYGPVIAAQVVLAGSTVLGWVTSMIGFVTTLGSLFLETAAAEGVLSAASATLSLTALPLTVALAAIGGVVYGLVSVFDQSSESADEFMKTVEKGVDTSSFTSIHAGAKKVDDEMNALRVSIAGARDSWGNQAAAVADILIPFHDVENSLNDQTDKLHTLNEAQAKSEEQTRKNQQQLTNYATASVLAANGLDTNSTACLAFTEANKGVNGQIDGTIEKLNAIAASQKIDLTTDDAVARVTAIYQQTQFATTSTLGLSDAQVKYNDAASTAKDKVDAYKMSLDALAGTHLTAAAAETSYSANSVSLLTTLTANKAIANGVTDASTASSLAQTKAINDNDKAIQDNVKSAMDLANAKYAETGSVDQATASLTTNRQALIDTMVQTGYTREEAEKYIDRLGLTPDNINTQVNLDAGEAKTDLTTVNEKLVTAGYGADGKVNIDTRKAEENLSGLERALKKIGDIGSGVINSFGDLFGGGREAGGPVAGGTAYLVGESGPELFMAGRSGTILSNAATRAALGGSGTTINVSVVHSGLGVDSPQLQREVVEVIRRYTARNGPVLVGASP